MKKFLLKSSLLVVIIIMIHVGLLFVADGSTDPYYSKLTSTQQSSLIIGGSRASEGVIPRLFDSTLQAHQLGSKSFNYAFTNSDSPYGPVYLNAIQQKIDPSSKNGRFILSVHPWGISSLCDSINDPDEFREKNLALGSIATFSGKPNVDYLLNAYSYGWGNFLLKKAENSMFEVLGEKTNFKGGAWAYVHDDGWLEVKTLLKDSTAIASEMKKKIAQWKKREINSSYKFSSKRLEYLAKTIDYLKQYGEVYLVRFPVHAEINQFEKKMLPNFNELMTTLSVEKNVDYFNFAKDSLSYAYSDGNHFVKSSAEKFSRDLALKIVNKKLSSQ